MKPIRPRSDPLLQLRSATADQHRAIERQRLIQRLVSPRLSIEDYLFTLAALSAWYVALERLIYPWLRSAGAVPPLRRGRLLNEVESSASGQAYHYVPRAALLHQDVVALCARAAVRTNACCERSGGLPDMVCPSRLPITPDIACAAQLVGVLYVIEGATQGGRVIAPLVEKRLGLRPGEGTSYFRLYEEGEWVRFRASTRRTMPRDAVTGDAGVQPFLPETASLDRDPISLAATAARQTFDSLHRHLDVWADQETNIAQRLRFR